MICPRPLCRLAPITTGLTLGNPRILLCANQTAGLMRSMEGWSRHDNSNPRGHIESLLQPASLSSLASDSFDLAVVQAVPQNELEALVRELVRVAVRA